MAKKLLKCETFHFGIDTVRFNFPEGFHGQIFLDLMKGLSLNSPQKYEVDFLEEKFTVLFSSTENKAIVQLLKAGDAVICIEKYLNSGAVKSVSYSVVFYSAYFWVDGVKGVLERFCRMFKSVVSVSRLDLCMDVSCTVDELWKNHTTITKKVQFYKKDFSIETFYLGAKVNNQKHFIRVYNKKLDSQKKNKFHLFLDYVLVPTVSRIELQMNLLSCKNFNVTVEDILVLHLLEKDRVGDSRLWQFVFRSLCFNRAKTCFYIAAVPKLNERFNFAPEQQKQVLDELPYARQMLGYAKKLHELGFNVIEYLTEKIPSVKLG